MQVYWPHLVDPITLFLLLLTAQYTSATVQPPISSYENDINIDRIDDDDGNGGSGSNPYNRRLNLGTLIVTVTLIVGFAFFGLFTTFCRKLPSVDTSDAGPSRPVSTSCQDIQSGLDPAAIEAFPVLTYSAAAALKIGKEALECAICLCDFTEEEFLRMLPNCCHVFHPECLGSWLERHVTCPVCRYNLAVGPTEKCERRRRRRTRWSVDLDLDLRRIRRSHSVDWVMGKDRHRLVLPEHVMKELVESGGPRRPGEVAVFMGGQGSGRNGFRSLSDRWTAVVFSRVFHMGDESDRSRAMGDGSVRKGEKDDAGNGSGKDIERGGCSDEGGRVVKVV